MSATGAGYDGSVSTFSPNGRVFQVEYAGKAVEKSGTAIGLRCIDGVVLGVEKNVYHRLVVEGSNRRIHTVDWHAGLAMSGMAADARQLVNKARKEATDYRQFYGTPISGKLLSERLALHIHTHTLYWYLRPFGCSILVASYEEDDTSTLYSIEPSGVCFSYWGVAIGRHKQGATSEMEKIDFTTLTCAEAVNELTRIIFKLHDEVKEKELEVELSWVGKFTDGKHVAVPKEIRDEAIRRAKEAKLKEEMDESDEEDEH